MKTLIIVFFCYLPLLTLADSASDTDTLQQTNADLVDSADIASIPPSRSEAPPSELKIVSLAPHLTEWVFSLGLGSNLVGVSDYSDYPEAAKSIERVADFQGADIAAIVALEPDLILAWEGGNKPQDIHKLASMGLRVFKSKVEKISDIASEIKRLGALTNTQKQATQLTNDFLDDLNALKREYDSRPLKPVFYYSWTAPLMTIGPNAWGNKLLNICGAQTLFSDSPVDYPQVSIKEVLIRQPHALIAASKSSHQELDIFWREHRNFLDAPLVVVNPDVTSRFSLRLINELKSLCEGIK
ncbi:cobalamin-binding protein [Alteromonas portus]|uniref:Cobalamin-binding protein n=1 Tax=Alteromonas portus TaxID=2565549 RepID=A0A4U0ZBI5_9ALTE|nr:cobalamin-binding protein [Alteromonas portus]TKB03179.1 cobalamin-binding protein [Alteromonas portus]